MAELHHQRLRARRARIDTYQQPVIYMHADGPVCRAEGFEAQAQVEVTAHGRRVLAIVHRVEAGWLSLDEAAFSDAAWAMLALREGDQVRVSHAPQLESLAALRGKVYGGELAYADLRALMDDASRGLLSDLHLAAFVTACTGRLCARELVDLTRAMVDVGERLRWPMSPVMDKHCVGGLPGNRTTPIVVAIVTACGVVMPKTSSRAITSPAGTADTMETLAPVELDAGAMHRVVEREGGCIVWGGAAGLSPADDVLIRVERPLDLDSEGQLVASVLSKKIAAGSERVVIDVPVGPTAKVRSAAAARSLTATLVATGRALGLEVRVVQTDGSQPVGRSIGPALEARDVLAVLRREPDAPLDLRERALRLAAEVLEMAGRCPANEGLALATRTLDDGTAERKFIAICEAQGGVREPPRAPYTHVLTAASAGRVSGIDSRRLARLAKLAGAPRDPAAGAVLHVRLGTPVAAGEPVLTLHAQSPGELGYALSYAASHATIIEVALDTIAVS